MADEPMRWFWLGDAETRGEPVGTQARWRTFELRSGRLFAATIFLHGIEEELSQEWIAFLDFLAERAVARCMRTT